MPERSKDSMVKLVSRMVEDIDKPTDDDWSQQDIMFYCLVKCYTFEETMDN
jgi:hypothetical protein